ncbi:MAG: type IV pilus modification PilV family protein, partial [bacterium]
LINFYFNKINRKGVSLLEILFSILFFLILILSFFNLYLIINKLNKEYEVSNEALAIASSRLETILYNSNLLTLKKVSGNFVIYNLIDQRELIYNSSLNVYEAFKKNYLANQIPYYFPISYIYYSIATRIRVYDKNYQQFYNVSVYVYHKNNPQKKYSISTIIKSSY